MNDMATGRAPAWLRIVALLALVWNLIGVYFYLVHVGTIDGPAMSDADRALAETMPVWATACFAIGVFGGTLGSLGLLLLKSWARILLLLSFLALLAEQTWYLLLSGTQVGLEQAALPVIILVVAALLAWLAGNAQKKGWLS